MSQSIIDGDLLIRGVLRCGQLSVPKNSVGDLQVSSASPIDSTKLVHIHNQMYSQPGTSLNANAAAAIHIGAASGTVLDISAAVTANMTGNATVQVDLRKNGTTILSGNLTLNLGNNPAFTATAGSIAVTSYSAGDVFSLHVLTTAGNGSVGNGLVVRTLFKESSP